MRIDTTLDEMCDDMSTSVGTEPLTEEAFLRAIEQLELEDRAPEPWVVVMSPADVFDMAAYSCPDTPLGAASAQKHRGSDAWRLSPGNRTTGRAYRKAAALTRALDTPELEHGAMPFMGVPVYGGVRQWTFMADRLEQLADTADREARRYDRRRRKARRGWA